MARAFLVDHGRYVAELDDAERSVLSGLMQQTRLLLSPEIESTGDVFDDLVASMGISLAAGTDGSAPSASSDEPDEPDEPEAPDDPDEPDGTGRLDRDPALARLLPTAHRGDDQIAAEFRRLTEEGLRQRKSGNLDVAIERVSAASDDRVELDDAQAASFLMALTDVRLLLAERMGMRTEEDAERLHAVMEVIDDDDPLGYAMAWYDFLTWLQETLTHALMGADLGTVDTSWEDEDDAPAPGDDASV